MTAINPCNHSYTAHLFHVSKAMNCGNLSLIEKIGIVVFHIITLCIPLAIYHLVSCAMSTDTSSHVSDDWIPERRLSDAEKRVLLSRSLFGETSMQANDEIVDVSKSRFHLLCNEVLNAFETIKAKTEILKDDPENIEKFGEFVLSINAFHSHLFQLREMRDLAEDQQQLHNKILTRGVRLLAPLSKTALDFEYYGRLSNEQKAQLLKDCNKLISASY